MVMSRAIAGAVVALATVAAVVFVGVAIHELNYAAQHPFAYGPAKVIAAAAGGGFLLCCAVGLTGVGALRRANAQ